MMLAAVVGSLSVQGAIFRPLRNLMSGISLSMVEPIDYSELRGLPKSFGFEAGENALQGDVPELSKDGFRIATFAGGCFWGTELHFQRVPGVVATRVGYTQGKLQKPSYREVCSGRTGHTEATQIIYDPKKCDYETLCRMLLKTIDPTLKDQVGRDYGTQYRHGIYAHSDGQLATATKILAAEQAKLPRGKVIHTECQRATIFWPAEEYHQQYLQKGGRFGSPQSASKGCADPVRCYG